MYKIELLTKNEHIIDIYYFKDWRDVIDKIEDIKKLKIDMKIDVFKEITQEIYNYYGDFSKIDTVKHPKKKKDPGKKIFYIIFVLIYFIIIFIIFLIKKLVKA